MLFEKYDRGDAYFVSALRAAGGPVRVIAAAPLKLAEVDIPPPDIYYCFSPPNTPPQLSSSLEWTEPATISPSFP